MARETINGISVPVPGTGEPADFQGDLRRFATDLPASFAALREADITITVGAGGDYASIRAAIAALTKMKPVYKVAAPNRDGGLRADILLLSGFVMAEQVFVHRQDLGWITVRAEDSTVTISRAALTVSDWGGTQAAFYGRDGATMPVIACLFSMDTSGTAAQQTGMTLEASSATFEKGTALARHGIINSAYRGINLHYGSRVSAVFGDFSGSGTVGIRAANGALFGGAYVKATNCGEGGASIGGAHANLDAAILTGSPIGIRAAGGATVSAGAGVDVSGCGIGFYSTDGAVISAPGAKATGCTSYGAQAMHGGRIDVHRIDATYPGDVSGAGVTGLFASHQGHISAQGSIANSCANHGVLADSGSVINFAGGSANNCPTGIGATAGGKVFASGASATGCTTFGAHANGCAEIDLSTANLAGAGTSGIRCRTGSRVNAQAATTRKGVSDAPQDTVVLEGGIINAHALVGGIAQTKNTLTASGVIFQA